MLWKSINFFRSYFFGSKFFFDLRSPFDITACLAPDLHSMRFLTNRKRNFPFSDNSNVVEKTFIFFDFHNEILLRFHQDN